MHINLELLEVPNIPANVHDAKCKIINKNFGHLLEISDKNTFNSPPKNVKDHVMVVPRLLINGDFHKAFNNIASRRIEICEKPGLRARVAEGKKVQEETHRTYLFTSSSSYDSLRVDQLANCFDLSSTCVYSIVSISVMNDGLHASWYQPYGCNVFRNVKHSTVQALMFELTEKLSILAEINGRATKAKWVGLRCWWQVSRLDLFSKV